MCQTVHFDCFKTDLTGEKMQKFLHQLNMILPTDVRVSHLQLAPELQVFQIFAPILRRSFLAIAAAPGPPVRVCFVARGGGGNKVAWPLRPGGCRLSSRRCPPPLGPDCLGLECSLWGACRQPRRGMPSFLLGANYTPTGRFDSYQRPPPPNLRLLPI